MSEVTSLFFANWPVPRFRMGAHHVQSVCALGVATARRLDIGHHFGEMTVIYT